MKTYGDLDFQTSNFVNNAKLILSIETDYPQTPEAGRVLFVGKRLLICVDLVSGVPVWVPLTNEIDSYIHTQTEASATWTIPHGLNANNVFVQVMDINGHTVIPNDIDLSVVNVATITFNTAIVGRAIAMLGSLSGVPKDNVVYTQTFSSSTTWVITHGLGYNPITRIYVGGYEIQPYNIVHDSTVQTTLTFSSAQAGYVNCI